jgi:eukaryotic translation initiation factor 2C
MIISSRPLNILSEYSIGIPYLAEGQDEPLASAITHTVRVVTPLSFSVSDLVSYLCAVNWGPSYLQKAEIVQVLNALFGHYSQAHDSVVSIGQNRHFSLDRSQQNAHRYFQSVRPATSGLLFNINVTGGIFLEPIRLGELFPKFGNKVILQKKMKLVRVRVTHIPAKKSKTVLE